MKEFFLSFDNREIAVCIWVLVLTAWAASKPDVRSSVVNLVSAAFAKQIVVSVVVFGFYFVGFVWILSVAGIWTVYLRDSRSHSVFIDPSGTVAYGVLGLTERIRDVIGGSGAMVETGLFRYGGRYVTDGIVSEAVWLGPQIKREYNDVLARLRSARAFHV